MKTHPTRTIRFAISAFFLFVFCGVCSAAQGPRVLNEKFAMRAVRVLHSAESTYHSTAGNGNYASANELLAVGLIDPALASGRKYGYDFVILVTLPTATSAGNFAVNATPQTYGRSGKISYFVDARGEIHGADKGGAPATASDPYIEDCTNGSIEQNERCSIQNLRLLYTGEITYGATLGNGNYGTFQQLYQANLIPGHLSGGFATGYLYVWNFVAATPGAPATFNLRTHPQMYAVTGIRSFYIDQTGVLRGADKHGAPASQDDPPINEYF